MVVMYIIANNPYMQRKHWGIFWINFRAEDNKIHTMPRKFKLSISIVTSAILTMFISDSCASVVLVALKGLP